MGRKLPQAVFLDRDGTIGESAGKGSHSPEDFALYPFSPAAIAALKAAGIRVFSFSNQPWIARGETTLEAVEQQLLSFGFDQAFICPHDDGDGCGCRKPLPGLLTRAAELWRMDPENCVVIGDSWRDMLAAGAVGARKILVRTGEGEHTLRRLKEKYPELRIDRVCENLREAVRSILE